VTRERTDHRHRHLCRRASCTVIAAMVIAGAVMIAGALLIWFVVGKHPAQGEGRENATHSTTESDRLYASSDRPAGPDAENA
jgi:hypothetical protein